MRCILQIASWISSNWWNWWWTEIQSSTLICVIAMLSSQIGCLLTHANYLHLDQNYMILFIHPCSNRSKKNNSCILLQQWQIFKSAWIVNEFSMVLPTCTYQYRLDYRMEISPQRRSTMEMLTQVHTYWDTSQCVKQGLKGNSRKQGVRMFILGSAHTPKYMSLNPNEWRICTQSMR